MKMRTNARSHWIGCIGFVSVLLASCGGAVAGEDSFSDTRESLLTSLAAGDFARLQVDTEAWAKEYERGSISGDEYSDRLKRVLPKGEIGKSWESDLRKWLDNSPKSYAPNFLLGLFYERTAFQLRGPKFASQTTAKQFADLREYAQKARDQLLSSVNLFSKPYPTYCELIDNAYALGDDKGEEYFRSALSVDSKSLKAWEIYLGYLSPKWGGDISRMNALVGQADASELPDAEKKKLVAENYTLQAQYAETREQYRIAADLYESAYETAPDQRYLWRLMNAGNVAKKGGLVDLAISLYARIIDADPKNVKALNVRGFLLENEKHDLSLAFKDYLASAEAGNDWAQNRVGWWYMVGKSVDRNLDQAQTYFDKAVAQGNTTAKANLKDLAAIRRDAH